MTKAQVERIVRLWQGRLGLERWDVKVDWSKPCADENVAEAERSQFYDSATLRLEPGWSKWTADYAEQAMVHELLHLCHRDTDQAFYDVDGQLQRDAWVMAERRYRQSMEGFIDRLASRLVELG